MKLSLLKLAVYSLMTVVCFSFSSCEKAGEEDAGSGSMNLSCGSSMPGGYQCIRAGGASTTTTYNIPELVGYWDSNDFDFCVKYSSNGTGVITYKPSAFVSGSTQNIKWGAMVNSKGELLKSNVGTIYIVHESTSGTPVDPQIASLSFKQSTKQWYGFDLVPVASCGTTTATPSSGQGMFWTASDQNCGPITVTINGQSKTITSYYSSVTPSCGANGCANFSLPAGTYSYKATCSSYQWSGSITITAGGCFKMKLT